MGAPPVLINLAGHNCFLTAEISIKNVTEGGLKYLASKLQGAENSYPTWIRFYFRVQNKLCFYFFQFKRSNKVFSTLPAKGSESERLGVQNIKKN